MSQSFYVDMVLVNFKYLDFRVAWTLIDRNHTLVKNKDQWKYQIKYARVLQSLVYIMIGCNDQIILTLKKRVQPLLSLSLYTFWKIQGWISLTNILRICQSKKIWY